MASVELTPGGVALDDGGESKAGLLVVEEPPSTPVRDRSRDGVGPIAAPEGVQSHMPEGVQEDLYDAFKRMDVDGDGVLTQAELYESLEESGIPRGMAHRLLRIADVNGDGAINFDEWCAAVERTSSQNRRQILRRRRRGARRVPRGVAAGALGPRANRGAREPEAGAYCPGWRVPLEPTSPARICWDLTMAVLLFWLAVSLPFELAFVRDRGPGCYVGGWPAKLDVFLDACFFFDIAMNFATGVALDDDTVTLDPGKVWLNYVLGWFALDLVSSIPFDCITGSVLPSMQPAKLLKVAKVAKVFKLLRLSKAMKIFKEGSPMADYADDVLFHSSTQTVIKVISILVSASLLCHWLACLMALSGDGFLDNYSNDEDDWLSLLRDGGNPIDDWEGKSANDWDTLSRYNAAIYWAMTTMTTVGYGDILPHSDAERTATCVAMVVGGSFYGFVIAQIGTIIGSTDLKTKRFYERMDLVAAWLEHHEFPGDLCRRVRKYLRVYLNQRTALDEQSILNDLNPQLRNDIAHYLIHDDVGFHPLFDLLPTGTLARIASIIQLVRVAGGEVVVHAGDPGHAMFVIKKGTMVRVEADVALAADDAAEPPPATPKADRASVVAPAGGRRAALGVGDSFGELVLLGMKKTYTFTVETTESSELHVIPTEDFLERFQGMPDILYRLKASLAADENLDMTKLDGEDKDAIVEEMAARDHGEAETQAALQRLLLMEQKLDNHVMRMESALNDRLSAVEASVHGDAAPASPPALLAAPDVEDALERCARGQHANVLVRTADDGLHLARLAPVHDDDGVNVAFVLVVLVDVACALDTQVADD
ncbi:voltage-gated potassium channel [Aureococcus anophagefferens]|nr:voltage-gated potassium channel [Aureococcus anophagefferens]